MKKHILILFLFVFGVSFASLSDTQLTLLHTNDLHAHLLPSNKTGQDCLDGPDCLGGLARLQTFVDLERRKDSNLLFLDAGDFFEGTFFYTFHKDKDLIPLLNRLSFDAITLGNHEFDDPPKVLEHFLKHISAPCVNSNIKFKDNSYLNGRLSRSLILAKRDIKIGIIGALAEDVSSTSMYGDVVSLMPLVSSLKKEIEYLQGRGISSIILLSHLGLGKDKELAQILPEIDIIIGGHTHNLLSNTAPQADGPYPIVIDHENGSKTLIVSTGAFGHYIGKLQVNIDEQGYITSYTGDTIPLSELIQPDKETANFITQKAQELDDLLNVKLNTLSEPILMTKGKNYCAKDCPVGSSITKMILSEVPGADIVLLNSGAIRSGFDKGDVLFKHIIQVLPFDSTAVSTSMTGKELKQYLEKGLIPYRDGQRINAFLQIAGADYQFNPTTRKVEQITINGLEIDPSQKYKIILPLFLAKGGDQFPPLDDYQILQNSMREMIQNYFSKTFLNPKENKNLN